MAAQEQVEAAARRMSYAADRLGAFDERGEASARRKEPKMLVGELTGLMMLPKMGEAMSASG